MKLLGNRLNEMKTYKFDYFNSFHHKNWSNRISQLITSIMRTITSPRRQ